MLVIASPLVDVSDIEVKKIETYLESGGNLFWLLDDQNMHGLQPIADYLGLELTPGTVVDPASTRYGADSNVAFNNQYGEHAITKNFMLRTLFPEARKIEAHGSDANGWQVSHLIDVAPNGWLRTVPANAKTPEKNDKKISFNIKTDVPGPINIAVALERKYGKKGQRVVVVGSGSFLANTFIGNGGNLDLGVNMINWLAGDDNLITIQPKPLKDVNVIIPSTTGGFVAAWLIFNGFQYFIPLLLLIAGIVIWLRRRKA